MLLVKQVWLLAVLELAVAFLIALVRAKVTVRAFGPLVFSFVRHQPMSVVTALLSLAWMNWLAFNLYFYTVGKLGWF